TMGRREFLDQYGHIRTAEGRGSDDPSYYRMLPFHRTWDWRIRAATFEYLKRHILPAPCKQILDLGAGNCWLSNRLIELGHKPVAVNLSSNPADGLRARRHYENPPPAIEADFHELPFPEHLFDLVIYNASFHYSPDYKRAIAEARRVFK